jgi:hypothetical protein
MKIQSEEIKEKNTKKSKPYTEEEIDLFCKSVEELLEDIHERCGDLN